MADQTQLKKLMDVCKEMQEREQKTEERLEGIDYAQLIMYNDLQNISMKMEKMEEEPILGEQVREQVRELVREQVRELVLGEQENIITFTRAYLDQINTDTQAVVHPGIPNFDWSSSRKPHVLLAATGCVKAKQFPLLCREVSKIAVVKAIATEQAMFFIDKTEIPNNVLLYTDEVFNWREVDDIVLQQELIQWADILVIAPLSANTLAKIALGFCDNLLTYVLRAWDFSKPIHVAPSMNEIMWQDSFTESHLEKIDRFGISLIPQMPLGRSSRNFGTGQMAEMPLIIAMILLFVHGIRSRVESI